MNAGKETQIRELEEPGANIERLSVLIPCALVGKDRHKERGGLFSQILLFVSFHTIRSLARILY